MLPNQNLAKIYTASAPGSLMLLGEYAVLHGYPALVCAVDQRVQVSLRPRTDDLIIIDGGKYGYHATSLSQLSIIPPFQFVTAALLAYRDKLTQGCELTITSDFSDQIGLGSSAAVTVAVLAALSLWLGLDVTPLALTQAGRSVVRTVQGLGSGADVAASVYGGIVQYQQEFLIEKHEVAYPLSLYYAGFKTKTVEAVGQVAMRVEKYPDIFQPILASIGQCAKEGAHFLSQKAWHELGAMMTIQQGLMEALGVSLPILRTLVERLSAMPEILGAKISGSGLGDCVVGLGLGEEKGVLTDIPGAVPLSVAMTLQGVQCEES